MSTQSQQQVLLNGVDTGNIQRLLSLSHQIGRFGEQIEAEYLSGVPRHETRDQGTDRHQDPRAEQDDEIQPAHRPKVPHTTRPIERE